MRPLDGCLVLDFSTLLPGPLATLLLAEAGAEVVKVERPGGDEMRSYEPTWGQDSVNFALLNRGKKSIAVDLKEAAGRQSIALLLARADVVVEQFRPGVMARFGFDYESVARRNRKVIYCSITGYGQAGPKSSVAAHDLNYIADTGLLALSMGPPAHAVLPPTLVADIAGGAYPAVVNILLALREREVTGRGRHLDIAMTDNLFPLMYWAFGSGLGAGRWPGNGTDLVTGGSPRYRLYDTRDEKVVAVAALEQKFWDTFCEVIGLEAQFRNDLADSAEVIGRISAIIAGEAAATWARRFAGHDCCCSIVVDIKQALNDPHFLARGLFHHVLVGDDGRRLPALPVPVDEGFRTPRGTALGAPRLGADNKEYLR